MKQGKEEHRIKDPKNEKIKANKKKRNIFQKHFR